MSPGLQWAVAVVRRLFALGMLLLLVASGYLWAIQDRMLFPGAGMDPGRPHLLEQRFPGAGVELMAADGVVLRGWRVAAGGPAPAPLLLYFGGNAEEVSRLLDHREALAGWTILTMNYRGFGQSDGTPSEEALKKDALAIYDWGTAYTGVDRAHVVAWGRSLGSGVAVHLAARRPLAGVILTTPFDSIRALAEARYPVLPVGLLLRHPFDSRALAPQIRTPVLALGADLDTLVPLAHAQRLLAAWGGPSRLEVLRGRDHHDILTDPRYWVLVRDWLSAIPGTSRVIQVQEAREDRG